MAQEERISSEGPQEALREPLLHPSEQGGDGNPTYSHDHEENRDVVIRCCGRRGRRREFRMNHNVFLNLILSVTYGMSDSLWSDAVLSAYLKQLYHGKNAPLGRISAVHGLSTLFSALPIGYLADKLGRSTVIRFGSVLFCVTAVLHAATTYWIGPDLETDDHKKHVTSVVLLSVVMALWGVGEGIVDGPCEALFADSTPHGSRSTYYTYLEICYLLATVLGPLTTIFLFQNMGNDWRMHPLMNIIYIGLGMEFLNAIIMMFFDDAKALKEDEEDSDSESESSDEESSCSSSSSSSLSSIGDEENDKNQEIPRKTTSSEVLIEEVTDTNPGDAFGPVDCGTTTVTVDSSPWKPTTPTQQQIVEVKDGLPLMSPSLSSKNKPADLEQGHSNSDTSGCSTTLTPTHSTVFDPLMPSPNKASQETRDTEDDEMGDCAEEAEMQPLVPTFHDEPNNPPTTTGSTARAPGLFSHERQSELMEKYSWAIPYIMFASEMVSAASLGLTDSFFPVYLKDDCGMSPTRVQIMYAIEPIIIAAMTWAVSRIAKSWGRIQTILVFYGVSIAFFAAIALYDPYLRHHHVLLGVLYVLTSAFGDSIHPLEESLLVDNVPKDQRARWMSLGAISSLGWSGTAVLGGYICDTYGYRGSFLATCAGETVSLVLFATLLPLVPRKEGNDRHHHHVGRRRMTATQLGAATISLTGSSSEEEEEPRS